MAEGLSTGKVVLIILVVIFLPTIIGVILALCLLPVAVIIPVVPKVTPVNETIDTIPQSNPAPADPGDGSVPVGITFGPASSEPRGARSAKRATLPSSVDLTKTSVSLTQKSETTALAENITGGVLQFDGELHHDQTTEYIFTFFWAVPASSTYAGYNVNDDSVQSGSSGYSDTKVTNKVPISSGRGMFSDIIMPFEVREKIRSRDTTLPGDLEIIETIMVFIVYSMEDAIAKGNVTFVNEAGDTVTVTDELTYIEYVEWIATINSFGLESALLLSFIVETIIYNS